MDERALWVLLICFIDKGEGLPQVKQVALQISLKSNLMECVILLCNDKGVERLEVFTVGGRHANSRLNTHRSEYERRGKREALNISLIKE